jgi:hypothetical protein
MIGTTLGYLRERIDRSLGEHDPKKSTTTSKPRVVFLDGNQVEPLGFPHDLVSMLLVNLEEDREQRSLDAYRQRPGPGKTDQLVRRKPDIRLSLYVLFVATFGDYITAWNRLSQVIQCFQDHPVLSADNDPAFPKDLGILSGEIITQSFRDQRDIWSSLRMAQRPSILYRFRLVTLHPREEEPVGQVDNVSVVYKVRSIQPTQ